MVVALQGRRPDGNDSGELIQASALSSPPETVALALALGEVAGQLPEKPYFFSLYRSTRSLIPRISAARV